MMRKLGFIVLAIGFLWLCASVLKYKVEFARISSQSRDAVPKKETFTRDEVMQHIGYTRGLFQSRAPWIFTPACLMLAGALILGFTRPRAQIAAPSK